jgi:hypothetical protein
MNSWTLPRRAGRIVGSSALLLAALSACSDSDPIGPGTDPSVPTLTVNAASGWTYVKLGTTASVVTVSDPTSSAGWDLAFNATSVMLNGGAAGPGGVEGYCLCQNASATDAQVKAMKAETQLSAFEGAGTTQLPTDSKAWATDALTPAITDWWTYNPATHAVGPTPNRSWVLRTASGTSFAKLRIAAVGVAGRGFGVITLEYAVQPSKTAKMGEVRTLDADVSSGAPVYVSLTKGAVSTSADWDLMLQQTTVGGGPSVTIRLNSGISGSGKAGAVLSDRPFEQFTDASEVPDAVFKSDAFGGVFDAHPWYRYNITGTDHQIWPTFDVYFVRRGAEVYKLQLTGYYDRTGKDRNVTFRYAKIAG